MIDPPIGLHAHDDEHVGETAAEWIAACDERMDRKAVQHRLHYYRDTENEKLDVDVPFQPGYVHDAVVEDLASLDPDFDRRTDQYDRIMNYFSSDVCCPGYSYLDQGHCPKHGG